MKFISNYPTVTKLADAELAQVLKDWQGLGYYSRARNLHEAARHIRDHHGGVFPSDHAAILALKGVGNYTAAAVASIAFDLPHPVVDGNVYRVIARYFGIATPIDTGAGQREVNEALAAVFDASAPGEFNQALMEFGALYCKPVAPDCEACIFRPECEAYRTGSVQLLPVKSKKTKIRNRYFYYLVLEDHGHVYMEQRRGNDIWQELYQFPLLETATPLEEEALPTALNILQYAGSKAVIRHISPVRKHILSHQRIFARMVVVQPGKTPDVPAAWIRVPLSKVDAYAVPVLVERFLESFRAL